MGLQEHAGEKEEAPDAQLDMGEEQEVESEGKGAAPEAQVDEQTDKEEAKEEEPQSEMEKVVAELIAQFGPQPPVEEFLKLATAMGISPSTPEYVELMSAVQKRCGNGYAEQVEAAFAQAPEAAVPEEKNAEEPEAEGNEAEAAKEEAPEKADEEQKAEDPAKLEQEGQAVEEVPAGLEEAPAVQEEVEAKEEEKQEAAPAAEEVKEENAEEEKADGEKKEEAPEQEAKAPETDLRRGDKSAEVEQLQNLLISLGLMTQEEMDTGPGIFGPRTENAVRAYQESMGLPTTGFYGPQTREALAHSSEPPSKLDQIILEVVAKLGPKPDFGVMVGVFMTVEASEQEEFMAAVARNCGDDYAVQLQQELASAEAKAAPAEEKKEEDAPNAEQEQQDEKANEGEQEQNAAQDQQEAPAPEEAPGELAPEEEAEVKAEVVEPFVDEEKKEEVAPEEQQAAEEEKEQKADPAVEEENQKAQEGEADKDEVEAAPDAKPEEKQVAAEEEQAELEEEPEEAQLAEEEKPEVTEEEQAAKKDDVEQELDEKVAEEPDNAESVAAMQELLAEADRLLETMANILQDPVLETTQDTVKEDAEAMLSRWDADLDNYVQNLEELADKLMGTDLGAAKGAEDVVSQAAAKAGDLQMTAYSLKGGAPTKVVVNAELEEGELLSFEAPISSRDQAVAEILQAFLTQMEIRDAEKDAEESQEGEAADEPPV